MKCLVYDYAVRLFLAGPGRCCWCFKSFMADSSSQSDILSLFVGFSPKGLNDSDSIWSPTSPLDFRLLFSTLSNTLSLKSPRSPSPIENHKKWDDSSIGLGIVNSIAANETNHVIFGAQVRKSFHGSGSLPFPVKSKSLPRNYTVLPQASTESPRSPKPQLDFLISSGEVSRSLSLDHAAAREVKPILSSRSFNLDRDRSPNVKQASLPISIGNSDDATGSLSATDIEDSEDYTCIISYGPNSKTTHIFGDRVLEFYTNSSSDSGREKQGAENEMPHLIESQEKKLSPCSSDESIGISFSCGELGQRDEEEVYGFGFVSKISDLVA